MTSTTSPSRRPWPTLFPSTTIRAPTFTSMATSFRRTAGSGEILSPGCGPGLAVSSPLPAASLLDPGPSSRLRRSGIGALPGAGRPVRTENGNRRSGRRLGLQGLDPGGQLADDHGQLDADLRHDGQDHRGDLGEFLFGGPAVAPVEGTLKAALDVLGVHVPTLRDRPRPASSPPPRPVSSATPRLTPTLRFSASSCRAAPAPPWGCAGPTVR